MSCHKDRSCDSVLSLSGEIMEENIAFVKVKKRTFYHSNYN